MGTFLGVTVSQALPQSSRSICSFIVGDSKAKAVMSVSIGSHGSSQKGRAQSGSIALEGHVVPAQ